MTERVWVLLFVLLCNSPFVMSEALPTPNFITGTKPYKSIKSWVRIYIVGSRDHLLPIVWVSPQKFKKEDPELLVVMSKDEYDSFTALLKVNECATSVDKHIDYRSLAVSEYSGGKESEICMISRTSACDYLTKIRSLPSISWTEEKVMPFRALSVEMGCEAPD